MNVLSHECSTHRTDEPKDAWMIQFGQNRHFPNKHVEVALGVKVILSVLLHGHDLASERRTKHLAKAALCYLINDGDVGRRHLWIRDAPKDVVSECCEGP